MSDTAQSSGTGTAMQRAVAAEHDARRAIAEAEAQAQATVEAARAQARAMASAVPARIARLRQRGERAVQRAIEAIRADEAAALARLRTDAFPQPLIERSVVEVARRLTGGAGP